MLQVVFGHCSLFILIDYEHDCSYAREVKRRGRRHQENERSDAEGASGTIAGNSTLEPDNSRHDLNTEPFSPAATSSSEHYTSHAERFDGNVSVVSRSASDSIAFIPSPRGQFISNCHPPAVPRNTSSTVWSHLTNQPGLHPSHYLKTNSNIAAGSQLREHTFSFATPARERANSTTHTAPAQTTETASSFSYSSPAGISPTTIETNDSQHCRFPILIPLLPTLADIVPVSVACDLLQLYFERPGNSLLKCASPYVLTHVLRRRALLHPSHPRPTSPALVLAMLHATAHTADIECFHVPGSRSIVCDKLYVAVVEQLNDLDYWHRLPSGRWVMFGGRGKQSSIEAGDGSVASGGPEALGPCAGTDALLAIILITVVVSGGTFKADCLRWWNKALRLARVLKLGRIDEEHRIEDSSQSLLEFEATEEKRRIFWLLFCLDRHLALSYNAPLAILDADVTVYLPLPEVLWDELDLRPLPVVCSRSYGPRPAISGTGFFEFFLPLMTILGDIISLHHRRLHPRFGALSDAAETAAVQTLLDECECSLEGLQHDLQVSADDPPAELPATTGSHTLRGEGSASHVQVKLVCAYSTHILHVLAVLLYGKWDPLTMLTASSTPSNYTSSMSEDSDDWIAPERFLKCTTHAISASRAVNTIIMLDPELVFMPYLFGIYLLHGSFILLLFADRMPQLGGPNAEVEQACETVIRAHEICVVTLSTEFQRSFRGVLRSTLYSVKRAAPSNPEEARARRHALATYRWARGGRGLAL